MINHLYGPSIVVFLKSSQTFPEGMWIGGHEFADFGRPSTLQSATDFVGLEVDVVDGTERRPSFGALVRFYLDPDSEAAKSMAVLPLSEHNIGDRTSITRRSGRDKIAMNVVFRDGSEVDLTGGSVITRKCHDGTYCFNVLFSDFHKE